MGEIWLDENNGLNEWLYGKYMEKKTYGLNLNEWKCMDLRGKKNLKDEIWPGHAFLFLCIHGIIALWDVLCF